MHSGNSRDEEPRDTTSGSLKQRHELLVHTNGEDASYRSRLNGDVFPTDVRSQLVGNGIDSKSALGTKVSATKPGRENRTERLENGEPEEGAKVSEASPPSLPANHDVPEDRTEEGGTESESSLQSEVCRRFWSSEGSELENVTHRRSTLRRRIPTRSPREQRGTGVVRSQLGSRSSWRRRKRTVSCEVSTGMRGSTGKGFPSLTKTWNPTQ